MLEDFKKYIKILLTESISKKKYLSLIRSLWSTSTGQFCGVLVINIAPDVIEKNLSNLFYKTVIRKCTQGCKSPDGVCLLLPLHWDECRNLRIHYQHIP